MSLNAVTVELDCSESVFCSVLLNQDVEVTLDLVVKILQVSPELRYRKHEKSIFLQDRSRLSEIGILVWIEEGTLHIYQVVDGSLGY